MTHRYSVTVENHIDVAIRREAETRGMTPAEICADLIELGLVSLKSFEPFTPVEEFAVMQRESPDDC